MNLARIDLVSLRLVVLCAEAGTLSAAARQAHLSLSGASHKLCTLEDALGTALFERRPRGLHPTRAGELVAGHARLMLGTLDHLTQKLSMEREAGAQRSGPAAASPLMQEWLSRAAAA